MTDYDGTASIQIAFIM